MVTSVDTCESALELAPHATSINESVPSQEHWRGQKSIVMFEDNNTTSNLISLRMRGDKFFEVNVDGDLRNLKTLTSCGIDSETGLLYVAPVPDRNVNLTREKCIQNFIKSVDLDAKVRVGLVYSEDNGIEGLDLGWYIAFEFTGRRNGSFLVLKRDETSSMDVYPYVERVGNPTVVSTKQGGTIVTNSALEGRVVRFFEALNIPFLDETRLKSVQLSNGSWYKVDFLIYPSDPEREAFIEVKPYRPTDVEIMKAGELHRQSGIDVYIMWGTNFVPGLGLEQDKWMPSGGMAHNAKYESGIRAARVFTNDDGDLDYEDGYYFMANHKAGGNEWEEDLDTPDEQEIVHVYKNPRLERYLEAGGRRIGPRKRAMFRMRATACTKSRVVTTSGRRFRPVDTFKPNLFKFKPFMTSKPSTHRMPGPGDWFSSIMQDAYRAAREM